VDKDLIEAHVPRRFVSHCISLSPIGPSACLCSLSLYIAVYNGITHPHPLGSWLSRLSSEGFKTHIQCHTHSFSAVRVSGAVQSACCAAAATATAANLRSRFVCLVNPSILFPRSVYCIRTLTRAWTLLQ